MLPRRRLLQSALAGFAVRRGAPALASQTPNAGLDRTRVLAVAEAVLPTALGAEGTANAVDRFLQWLRDYREGAERDHGYGVTAIRVLPASPARGYAAHLDDLDRRAGGSFAGLALADRRRVVTAAIDAAPVKELPGRPNGVHVAVDLMAHYFNSAAAADAAYDRAIGRGTCRDLAGSEARPSALSAGVRR